MAQVIWTENAICDINKIAEYIAADSEYYATEFVKKIFTVADKLARYPEVGQRVPELPSSGLRQLTFKKYRIIYKYDEERVNIITVHHAARLLTNNDSLKDLFE